ncbi:MAG TPA: M20/M25/M40 family metallo-hydrolase [Thermoanaerobaculia bacterium]|nr:M20/M25/M40 family metallo-hydrolase [Thermoanaerobaculia bacterium]
MRRSTVRVAAALLAAAGAIPASPAAAQEPQMPVPETTATPAAPARAALDPTERRIVEWIGDHVDEAIALVAESVEISSPTGDLAGVRRVGDLFARQFEAIGFATRWVDLPPELDRAGHLVAERRGPEGKRVLVIGHLDTVLPSTGWRREGNAGHGVGASDMKGGNVVALYALAALEAAGALDGKQVIVVFTGDEEEPGRPREVAREALVAAARESDVALGFEGAVPGTATVARRGISSWALTVTATTGHSSLIFKNSHGYGAIYEAARILDAMRREVSAEELLTANPGLLVGGATIGHDSSEDTGTAAGKTNVIAERVYAEGDLRFISPEQLAAAEARLSAIATTGNLPGTRAGIEFFPGYPPMAPTPGNHALLAVLDEVSRDLGYGPVEPHDPGARGAADVSFVAREVEGALDGLGAMGHREHAADEWVELDKLPMLIERAALLVHRLLQTPREATP